MEKRTRHRHHSGRPGHARGFTFLGVQLQARRDLHSNSPYEELTIPQCSVLDFYCLHGLLHLQVRKTPQSPTVVSLLTSCFSLIWPAAVAKLYTGLSHQRSRTLSSLVPMCFVLGQVLGAFIANWVHPKKILVVTATSGAALIASLAADPLNMNLTMGLLIVGCFLVGMMDGVAIAMSTFPLRLQEELGTAGGMSGAIRSTGSSIATVVYGTILANRLSKLLPSMVGIASTEAGLPASSVTSLISALDTGGPINLDTVPGISDQILDIAQLAYRQANARAYKTVFLSTLGFGGLGAILAWFAVGVPAGQENLVAGHIHRPTDEEALEQED